MAGYASFPLEPDRLLGILDSMNDGVYVISEQFDIEYANAAIINEFGTIPSKKCYQHLHNRTEPCPWCKMADILAGKSVRWEWECSQNGKFYDCLDAPVVNPDGSVSKLKILRDITERKQADREIRDLAKFPSENPSPVVRIAKDGTLLYSNVPGAVLLEHWGRTIGQSIPTKWQKFIDTVLTSGRTAVHHITIQNHIFSIAMTPVVETGYVNIYGRDITKQKESEAALRVSEQRVRKKLESLLLPEGDIGQLELADIIDVPAVQSLMDDFYQLAHIPMSIIDLSGKPLVGVGWQTLCSQFHRVNPQTCRYCLESDLELSAGVDEGSFKLYKCKNNMWDAASPIIIGGKKMGNLFTGQFFFDDEQPDYDLFRAQAKKYGFNEAEYLAALKKVPHLSRDTLHRGMNFMCGLSKMISQTSYSNLKLARLIEEHKRIEQTLRESEMRFRTIFETKMDGMLITDRDSKKFIIANEAICQMLGYNREEMTTLSVKDIHRSEDLPLVEQHFENLATGKIRISMDIPVKRKDGSVIFADIIANPIILSGKEYLVGSFRDVTDRRRAEAALRQSREDLNRAQAVGNIGSWRLDVRSNELTWSDETYRIFGVPQGTPMTYEDFLAIVHPDDRDSLNAKWKAGLDTHDYDIHHRLIADGQIKWVREKAYLEFDENGELVGGFGIVQDITRHVEAEEALQAAAAAALNETKRLEAVMETLPVGVAILDEKGGNIRSNKAYEAIWRGPRPEVNGIDDYAAYKARWYNTQKPLESGDWASAIAVQTGQIVIGQELEIERFDGTLAYVHNSAAPIRDTDGNITGCAVGILDITPLKQMEADLRQAHAELEARVRQRTSELSETVALLEDEIRHRGAAEKIIKMERKRFEDVLEMMPAYAILLKPDYHIAYANGTFRKWFGDNDGKKCYAYLFNRSEPCEHCETFKVLKTHTPHIWEWTGPNGCYYDIYDYPFTDSDGSPLVMEIGVDITSHKRQQLELQVSEIRLLEAQRVAHLGNWEWNLSTNVLWWSDEVYRIFGLSPRQFSATFDEFLSYVHPGDQALVRQAVETAISKGQPYHLDHRVVRPDGIQCVVHEQAELIYDAGHHPVRMVGTVHDITDRVRAEEAVRQSEERFRLMAQASEDVFWMSTPGIGQMLYISPAYEKLWGKTCISLYRNPQSFLDAVHPEDREMLIAGIKGHAEGRWNFEYRIFDSDGKIRWMHDIGYPVRNEKGELTLMAGMIRDITIPKKAEEERIVLQKELRSLAAQLQLAEEHERRRIARDLHDSIGQILSFSGSELKSLERMAPTPIADSIRTIARQLDIAVEQARTLSFDLSPGLLYDLGLEVAIEDLADKMSRERKIKCIFECCPLAKPLTDDVKVLLYRSVRELLINAAKHAKAEKVKISCVRSGADIQIKVEDNGRGFDVSILKDRTKSVKGFGLMNLRERLEYIGGRFEIKSVKEQGTTAIMIAPLNIEDNTEKEVMNEH